MRAINKIANSKRTAAFPTEVEAHEAKLRKANELLAKANLTGLPKLPERPANK